jgi:A/G-specific adenine glycosylase
MAGRGAAAARMTAMEPGALRLQAAALEWYEANGRDLAFRRTSDPWAVLVSEVMAQQTQAARAAEAWAAFMERYPTPAALAATSTAEVIRAWRGLGYNRRAVALRAAAIGIVEHHDGRVPDSLEALQALPGIGPYTARAVLAIAFGQRVAALDTNIRRVLERALGLLPAGAAATQAAADCFVPRARPAAWTHALMDIGATICRTRDPRCRQCPLAAICRSANTVAPSAPKRSAATASFPTTNRWLRGRILDRLRDANDGAWVDFTGPIGSHPPAAVRAAVISLGLDGLLELDGEDATRARLAA